jgi:hypothetical protein
MDITAPKIDGLQESPSHGNFLENSYNDFH